MYELLDEFNEDVDGNGEGNHDDQEQELSLLHISHFFSLPGKENSSSRNKYQKLISKYGFSELSGYWGEPENRRLV